MFSGTSVQTIGAILTIRKRIQTNSQNIAVAFIAKSP